jgi:hypothetical protein
MHSINEVQRLPECDIPVKWQPSPVTATVQHPAHKEKMKGKKRISLIERKTEK